MFNPRHASKRFYLFRIVTTFYHVGCHGRTKKETQCGKDEEGEGLGLGLGLGLGFGIRKGNENNSCKRKLFPEKSNPRVREEGHLCLFRSPSDQCPSYAVPRIYDPFLTPFHSPQHARVTTYYTFFSPKIN
ncbi:hypothetical protein VNO77_25252 [Canavalia gladiata]|uniref:Uncharacterized protein n=1 Tax=Canavalia gladiata TaxID=3824 RepID=A0AAN9LCY3_CANGL